MKRRADPTFDDFLKVGELAFSALLGAGQEMKAKAAHSRESVVRALDLVTREEFDASFAMIQKVRLAQNDLNRRLRALEKKSAPSRPKKSPAKKKTAKK